MTKSTSAPFPGRIRKRKTNPPITHMLRLRIAMGHQRRFDVGGMSAIAPIATKMLRRDERRKGPDSDMQARCTFASFPR